MVISEQEVKRKRLMKSVKMKKLIEVRKLLKDEIDMEPWGRDAQAKVVAIISPLITTLIQFSSVATEAHSSIHS